MRTEELIRALSVDRLTPTSLNRSIGLALLGGSGIAVMPFLLLLGIRNGAAASLAEWRFLMKFIVTLGLTLPAIAVLLRVARPYPASGSMVWWLLLLAPAALAIGVAGELMSVPATAWQRRLIGTNALHCVTLIPMLSLAPLVCVFAALKRGAPENPQLAGAVGGLVSAGIAATLYALNCPDDSPLFVATWYVIAIAGVALLAGAVGGRLLRW